MSNKSDTSIANIANKFVDKSFYLGDVTGQKGWDCLNSIAIFYESLNFKFPRKFENWNEFNYAELWKKNEILAKETFKKFLKSLGKEIDRRFILRGDLIIMEGYEMTFPAIYLGNDIVMMVFDKGVKCLPLHLMRKFIVEVRRLIE